MIGMDQLTASWSIVLSIGALTVFFFLYRNYQVDKLREHLFALRDEMFDYADTENLFDSQGYIQLRNIMNSMIRFSHKLTFFRLALSILLAAFVPYAERPRPYNEWKAVADKMPASQRKALEDFHFRMMLLMLHSMVKASPVLFFLGICFAIQAACQRVGGSVTATLVRNLPGLQLLEAQALQSQH